MGCAERCFLVVLLFPAACGLEPPEEELTSELVRPVRADQCSTICATGAQNCRACLCAAYIGRPSPAAIQPLAGRPIKTFYWEPGARRNDGAVQRVDGSAKGRTHWGNCLNPALLPDVPDATACMPGSRAGTTIFSGNSISGGETRFWFIARKKAAEAFGTAGYNDYGLIGWNETTGITCFYDDNDTDGRGNTEPIPDVDIRKRVNGILDVDADGNWVLDPRKAQAFHQRFRDIDGGSCTETCHDSAPRTNSPYLSYKSNAFSWNCGNWCAGDYFVLRGGSVTNGAVTAEITAPRVGAHLREPGPDANGMERNRCAGACHRIGVADSLKLLGPDAVDAQGRSAKQRVCHRNSLECIDPPTPPTPENPLPQPQQGLLYPLELVRAYDWMCTNFEQCWDDTAPVCAQTYASSAAQRWRASRAHLLGCKASVTCPLDTYPEYAGPR